MFFVTLLLSFFIIQLSSNNYVRAQDPLYECYAFTDPHIYSWHQKGSGYNQNQYQNCYQPGAFPLVMNEFVKYQVQTLAKWMTEIDIYFYDGTSKIPFCLITSDTFEIYTDDNVKCAARGVTWKRETTPSHYVFTVTYLKANFSTTIQHQYASRTSRPHFNIHAWQGKSLAARSRGLCTLNDVWCKATVREAHSEVEVRDAKYPSRIIMLTEARTICQAYVNSYIEKNRKARYYRSGDLSAITANVLNGCIEDLVNTGEPEVARSSLNMIMIEQLTNGVTSVDSIQTTIESAIQEASILLEEAIQETENKVAEILGLTTETPVKTTLSTTTTTSIATTTSSDSTTFTAPLGSFKCAIYQDLFIQTWHLVGQVSPPTRSCLGTTGNFELIRNAYVRFTIRTDGSVIEELTLVLFNGLSPGAICTVTIIGENAEWMDCENNGIYPQFIKTNLYESLTVDYPKGNFTTKITRNIGINFGRFNIDSYLNPESAAQSSGICNILSPCSGSNSRLLKKRHLSN